MPSAEVQKKNRPPAENPKAVMTPFQQIPKPFNPHPPWFWALRSDTDFVSRCKAVGVWFSFCFQLLTRKWERGVYFFRSDTVAISQKAQFLGIPIPGNSPKFRPIGGGFPGSAAGTLMRSMTSLKYNLFMCECVILRSANCVFQPAKTVPKI